MTPSRLTLLLPLLVAGLLCATPAGATAERVGDFTAASDIPPPWRVVQFDRAVPPTRYRLIAWDGVAAVEAVAERSMALLARPLKIDLARTPVLCWRWRIDAPLQTADLTRRAGDDFAARVYVAFEMPPDELPWSTRLQLRIVRSVHGDLVPDAALNYVWDNRQPEGGLHPNAYTDRAQMFVLRSGGTLAGRWVTERRNVRDDVMRAFGPTRARPSLLALATDTDNTGERARAGYADLQFVAADQPCG